MSANDTVDLDPEVVADMQKRDASERDRTRARSAVGFGGNAWTSPKFVGKWRCANPECAALVDITEEAFEALCTFNGKLRSDNQQPLDTNKIARCPECVAKIQVIREEKQHERREQLAYAIQQLKQSRDPRNERDLVEKIKKLHHPDVEGLLESLCGDNGKPTRKGNRKL